jgi:hypothetical protein
LGFQARSLDGSTTSVPAPALEDLRARVHGDFLAPGEAGYDASRSIWNAMIDRRPALVVHCTGAVRAWRSDAIGFMATHSAVESLRRNLLPCAPIARNPQVEADRLEENGTMGEKKQKKDIKKPKSSTKVKSENLPPHLKRASTTPASGSSGSK